MPLRAEGVEFRYGRSSKGRTALRGVHFSVTGPVVGLVGPNGAGKTTLLRCVAALLRPTAGRLWVGGLDPAAHRRRFGIGYLPERDALPRSVPVAAFLKSLAALCGAAAIGPAADAALAWAGLERLKDARIGSLSHGLRRRVALAAAEMGRPSVLVLDEPTNGLDPIAIQDLRARVAAWRAEGRLVILSSHHLDEVRRVADELIVLWEGRIRAHLSRAEVEQMGAGALEAFFSRFPRAVGDRCGRPAP